MPGAVQLCQSSVECVEPGLVCAPVGAGEAMICSPREEGGTAIDGGQGEAAADGAPTSDAPPEDASPGDTSAGDAAPSSDADSGGDSRTSEGNADASEGDPRRLGAGAAIWAAVV